MNVLGISLRVFIFGLALLSGIAAVSVSRVFADPSVAEAKPSALSETGGSTIAADQSFGTHEFDLAVSENRSFDFDPTGSYSLNLEKTPKAFADIEFVSIETRKYIHENGAYMNRPIVPTGALQSGTLLNFTRIAVANREISFETESKGGVSYKFVGNFPESVEAINCEGCDYPPDLTGRLTKLKNGKIIAELDAKLYVFGC